MMMTLRCSEVLGRALTVTCLCLSYLKTHKNVQDVEKIQECRSLIQDLEKELKYELLAASPRDEP